MLTTEYGVPVYLGISSNIKIAAQQTEIHDTYPLRNIPLLQTYVPTDSIR